MTVIEKPKELPGEGRSIPVLDAIVPFAAVIAVCVWQLWVLRRPKSRAASPKHLPRDNGSAS